MKQNLLSKLLILLGISIAVASCEETGTDIFGGAIIYEVKGVVTTTDGKPIKGIQISTKFDSFRNYTLTGDDGSYTIPVTTYDGSSNIIAMDTDGELNGGRFFSDEITVHGSKNSSETRNFTLHQNTSPYWEITIKGKITNTAGEPIEGMCVSVDTGQVASRDAYSDNEGNYVNVIDLDNFTQPIKVWVVNGERYEGPYYSSQWHELRFSWSDITGGEGLVIGRAELTKDFVMK